MFVLSSVIIINHLSIGTNYLIRFFIIEIPFNINRKWGKNSPIFHTAFSISLI